MPSYTLRSLAACVVVALIAAAAPGVGAHKCVHDAITANLPEEPTVFVPTSARPSVEAYEATNATHRHLLGSFGPIRLMLDTSFLFSDPGMMCTVKDQVYTNSLDNSRTHLCSSADVLTSAKRDFLIQTVLEEARTHFTRALSVESVVGNLVLAEPTDAYCASAEFLCCKKYMPSQAYNSGYANTDYVLFISGRPTSGSTIAWALTCQSDSTSRRPIAGHANFGPALITTTAEGTRAQVSTAVHEISHALGFNSDKFGHFRVPGTTTARGRSNVIKSFTERGHTVSKIITENVVATAKSHFDCPDWGLDAGGEVEDGGAAGTVGSHWEKRVFMNEYMTGTLNSNLPAVYSALTLALFEDSGWYQVDYTTAEQLAWGNGEGCNFAQNYCNTWSDKYFCAERYRGGCFPNLFMKGSCNFIDYQQYGGSKIPSYYQPFEDEYWGGDSAVADYCPYYSIGANADCRDSTNTNILPAAYGEETGVASRCFTGTFSRSDAHSTLKVYHAGCLRTTCDALSGELVVQLRRADSKATKYLDVTCPRDGGEVDLGTATSGEFVGTVSCPEARTICTGNPCDTNTCSGHGSCQEADGTCICAAKYYGDDPYHCDLVECPNSAGATEDCSGHGTCEHSIGKEDSGQCTCDAKYHSEDCSEVGCPTGPERTTCDNANPPNCVASKVTCDGHGTCDTGTGVCHCDAGYIGNACQLTDCPKDAQGVECSGHGTCDSTLGFCECNLLTTVAPTGETVVTGSYRRSNCSELHEGTAFTPIYFTGEPEPTNFNVSSVDPATGKVEATTMTLVSQEYTYFSFPVESVNYQMSLKLKWTNVNADPQLVACYASACTKPTLGTGQFFVSDVDKVNQVKTILFTPDDSNPTVGTVGFDQVGDMRVAMISQESTGVEVSLTRDACSTLQCVHGTCRNQACDCDIPPVTGDGRYGGWSGPLCDAPSCPGQPFSCGDFRGSCQIEDPSVPLRQQFPVCRCNEGFDGIDCMQTQTSGFTQVNATLPTVQVGQLDIGKNKTYFFEVDAGQGVLVKLISHAANADPILLGQPGRVPPIVRDASTAFDNAGWVQRKRNHTLSIGVVSKGIYFVRVANGRYATEPMPFTVTFERASGCPTLLNNCNGRGSCNQVCRCNDGWEGVDCNIRVPKLQTGTPTQVSVDIGDWTYYVFEASVNATEVEVRIDPVAVSRRAEPLLMVGVTTQRRANNLRLVTDESALFDFDGYTTKASSQSVVIKKRGTAFYFIGVHNTANSWAPIIVTLSVTERKTQLFARTDCLTTQAARDECSKQLCHGRGTYARDATSAFCLCESGWFGDTYCNTPRFASFVNLLAAAQEVGFLCNLCSFDLDMQENGLKVYKIPQPLQKATGLQIQARSANVSHVGNPSLLVSQYLPRSIVDFQFVSSSSSSNESLTLRDQSPTGRYWLAMYANTAATYTVEADRAALGGTTVLEQTFMESLVEWVSTTQIGMVTSIVGAAIVGCLCCGCVYQICTSGVKETTKKLQHNVSELGHGVRQMRNASTRMLSVRNMRPRNNAGERASHQLALQLAAIASDSRASAAVSHHGSPVPARPPARPQSYGRMPEAAASPRPAYPGPGPGPGYPVGGSPAHAARPAAYSAGPAGSPAGYAHSPRRPVSGAPAGGPAGYYPQPGAQPQYNPAAHAQYRGAAPTAPPQQYRR